MSFSCTIKAGKIDLTEWPDGPIHCQLLNLGPNTSGATKAPYRVTDFRDVISSCVYGDRLKEAARDCFVRLQSMAATNLASLFSEQHCESCTCTKTSIKPKGWSEEALKALIEIDPNSITYIHGGY